MHKTLKTVAAAAVLAGAALGLTGSADALPRDSNNVEMWCNLSGGQLGQLEFMDPTWSEASWWAMDCLTDEGWLACSTLPRGVSPRGLSGNFDGDLNCDFVLFDDPDDSAVDGEHFEDEPSPLIIPDVTVSSTGSVLDTDGPDPRDADPGSSGQVDEPSSPTHPDVSTTHGGSEVEAPVEPADPTDPGNEPADPTVATAPTQHQGPIEPTGPYDPIGDPDPTKVPTAPPSSVGTAD